MHFSAVSLHLHAGGELTNGGGGRRRHDQLIVGIERSSSCLIFCGKNMKNLTIPPGGGVQVGGGEGRSEKRPSGIVCLRLCFHGPFLGIDQKLCNQRSFFLKTEQNAHNFLFLSFFLSFSRVPTVFPLRFLACQITHTHKHIHTYTCKGESRAADSRLQSQIKQMASARHKGLETDSVGHLYL